MTPDLDVYIKWENQQVTGSFKVRGALNKVLGLQPWELEQRPCDRFGRQPRAGRGICCPPGWSPGNSIRIGPCRDEKVAAMRSLGAEVILVPGGYSEAEAAGIRHASEHSATWISPYNDGQVIAGQGTLGIELAAQLKGIEVKAVICPAGGGGLVSGVGALPSEWKPDPEVIAVQSEASPFLHGLYTRGTQKACSTCLR